MTIPLSEKQQQVLEFIRRKITAERLPPTIREIAAHFGFSSTGTVRDHLQALAQKGYLVLNRHKARAIELKAAVTGIPILGRVAAGSPTLAVEDIEGYLEPDSLFDPADGLFALRVKGDSMVEAGIMEADIVVVRRQPKAENGDIVVALMGEEATVKRFRKLDSRCWLIPANKSYKPIPCNSGTAILGKVTRVIRSYV
jgi:repressor LexA